MDLLLYFLGPSHAFGSARCLRRCLAVVGVRVFARGQLQHGHALAFAQIGHKYDFAARKLESVVVHARLGLIHAPKTGHLGAELTGRKDPESGFALDFPLKREFGSGHQANGNVWLTRRTEAAGEGVCELGRDELVAHFGGA